MKWCKKTVCKLIPLIRSNRVLWDTNAENFWDLRAKLEAFERIADAIGIDSSEVQRKVNQLKLQFLREWYKMKKTKISNPVKNGAHKPIWYGFQPLSFLKMKHKTQRDIEKFKMDKSCQTMIISSTTSDSNDQTDTESVIVTSSTSNTGSRDDSCNQGIQPTNSNRSMNRQLLIATDAQYNSYKGSQRDEFDLFGGYVAGELRKFSHERQILAVTKNKINHVLFEGDLLLIQKSRGRHNNRPYIWN